MAAFEKLIQRIFDDQKVNVSHLQSEEHVVVLGSLSEMFMLDQVNSYCVNSFTTELSGC